MGWRHKVITRDDCFVVGVLAGEGGGCLGGQGGPSDRKRSEAKK